MTDEGASTHCRAGAWFGVGVSVGVVVGLVVGSVLGLRLGPEAVHAVRGLVDRMSGRRNQVNFELLLQ